MSAISKVFEDGGLKVRQYKYAYVRLAKMINLRINNLIIGAIIYYIVEDVLIESGLVSEGSIKGVMSGKTLQQGSGQS